MKISAECGVRNAEYEKLNMARPNTTPHFALSTSHLKGFTLLEVMVAVAILAMVLVTLLGLKNRSMQDVMLADHITTATLLAKREMTEMLRNPAARPKESESEGEFTEEEEFRDYTWKKTITALTPIENVSITEIRMAVLWKEGDRQEMVELVSYE
jgi:general secretion pathway protein I